MTTTHNDDKRDGAGGLGTFAGVFTPSILTILGIILFLRLGYVVGSAGLGRALIIMVIANAISVLTSFSLSAIATNLRVKGGGDYYLISRTLGVEFGGALGIVLFLAQSISIAFYCIGFGEAVAGILHPAETLSPQVLAAAAVLLLFVFAWMGADWAARFQYVVMGMLALALLSFTIGGVGLWEVGRLTTNWSAPEGGGQFWVLFAIFFPAVTGFTQGVSMSGDLRDPAKSLPLGTFLAVGISIVVYLGSAILFAGALDNRTMMTNYAAMKLIARFPTLIDAGVVAATLSSAMASFMGAPRILQSLAADKIFPFLNPFAKGAGPDNNPRRGVLLSAALAFATISAGNLNLIAAIVSMFFLISYGLLNYATYYESRSESPSFRPTFRWYHRSISLAGWLACLGIILAIDVKNGIVAVTILFGIFQYLKRTATTARWADSRRAYYFQQIRDHLIAAAKEPAHPRNWRPHVLAFCEDSSHRYHLLQFSSWIVGKSGVATAVQMIEADGVAARKQKADAESSLQREIDALRFPVFPLVVTAPNLEVGIDTLIQSFGIGPLRANTVALNWFERLPTALTRWKEFRYGRILRTSFRQGCNTIIFSGRNLEGLNVATERGEPVLIDVWWWNDASSRLIFLLAYLMTRHPRWEQAIIRILAANYPADGEAEKADLTAIIAEARIGASFEILPDASIDRLAAASEDAAIVFAPFRFHGQQLTDPLGGDLKDLIVRIPNIALVIAAEDIDLDSAPEEGEAGEKAAVLDALEAARRREKKAQQKAAEAAEIASRDRQQLEVMQSEKAADQDDEAMSKLEKKVQESAEKAEQAARKAAKAAAKVEIATKEASDLGAVPEEKE